jgi:hypothetical protein
MTQNSISLSTQNTHIIRITLQLENIQFSYTTLVPCVLNRDSVIWRSCDRSSWQNIYRTPTRCTDFSNLFWKENLHVSDSFSVHHQEFFIVHTAMVYVIQGYWQLASRVQLSQRPTTLHVCKTRGCCCSFELLMMDCVSLETCWASYKHRIINLDTMLHLIGYFCMNHTMMHGSTNIKIVNLDYWSTVHRIINLLAPEF